MNVVAKPLKSLRLQGGCWIGRLSAWVHARCHSRQAQRSRVGRFSGCSRWLMNHPGSGLHWAASSPARSWAWPSSPSSARGRSVWSLRVSRGVVRVLAEHSFNRRSRILTDGGMTVNLRMLRRIDQGEEVEAAVGAVGGELAGLGAEFQAQLGASPKAHVS